MSKAVPGDGKMREDVKAAGEALLKAATDYNVLVLADPAHTQRHMSAASAEEQQTILAQVTEISKVSWDLMENARRHHAAQTSVLSNNLFGQRRRIKEGKVVIIDKVDPVKLADSMNKYGWSDLETSEQAAFMLRAGNPKAGFHDLTDEEKKAYLAGRAD